MLPGCLARFDFVEEVVVVVDDRTRDESARVAAAAGATVLVERFEDFSQFKNLALERCTQPYVLLVDADERVSHALAAELCAIVNKAEEAVAVALPVRNYFYGQEMRFGGWTGERPLRLLPRTQAWYEGRVHEHVVLSDGVRTVVAQHALVHFSHRSVVDNLRKSASYVALGAADAAEKRRPPTWGSMTRRALGELTRRLLLQRGWRDGAPGFIESVYQSFAVFCIEVRRWEVAQRPTIEERYRRLEADTR